MGGGCCPMDGVATHKGQATAGRAARTMTRSFRAGTCICFCGGFMGLDSMFVYGGGNPDVTVLFWRLRRHARIDTDNQVLLKRPLTLNALQFPVLGEDKRELADLSL